VATNGAHEPLTTLWPAPGVTNQDKKEADMSSDCDEPEPYPEATPEEIERYVGKYHVFEDGDKIEVIQIKRRYNGPWVTYHVTQGPGIPRKLVMMLEEFTVTYGHLF
jgi:hypothetical protein